MDDWWCCELPNYDADTYFTEELTTYSEDWGYVQETLVEPAYVEPAYVEPAYVEPAYVEPAYVEPVYIDVALPESEPVELVYGDPQAVMIGGDSPFAPLPAEGGAPIGDGVVSIGGFDLDAGIAPAPSVLEAPAPVDGATYVVGGSGSAPGAFVGEVFSPGGYEVSLGGPYVDVSLGMTVDPFADIEALIHTSPSYSPEVDYQLAMGAVMPSIIRSTADAVFNAERAMSPTFVTSDNFGTDTEYRLYNGMRE